MAAGGRPPGLRERVGAGGSASPAAARGKGEAPALTLTLTLALALALALTRLCTPAGRGPRGGPPPASSSFASVARGSSGPLLAAAWAEAGRLLPRRRWRARGRVSAVEPGS